MNDFPKPPNMNKDFIPPDPPGVENTGVLTPEESDMILSTCLTPRHRDDPRIIRFIGNYLRCRNSAQAARESGMTPLQGRNLRACADVGNAINKISDKSINKFGFDAAEVVERVKEITELDPIEFENLDGSYKARMSEIRPEVRRCIKKFKVKNVYEKDVNGIHKYVGHIIEIEMYDKLKSIDLMGREKDLFKQTTKVIHDVTKNMESSLLGSARRADKRLEEPKMKDVTNILDIKPTKEKTK